jgi:hypothetical protein
VDQGEQRRGADGDGVHDMQQQATQQPVGAANGGRHDAGEASSTTDTDAAQQDTTGGQRSETAQIGDETQHSSRKRKRGAAAVTEQAVRRFAAFAAGAQVDAVVMVDGVHVLISEARTRTVEDDGRRQRDAQSSGATREPRWRRQRQRRSESKEP